MSKIDYPRASLRAGLQLADAVDGFAGSCSAELAAEKLGKKLSGAFSAQIGAAVKYGLIENKASKLTIRPLYRDYKLAYTPEEASGCLRQALLSPPLFNAIYDRFKGQKLPIEHFEKMLIKEFDVPREISSRVAGYFLDGAKQSGLMGSENFLIPELNASSEVVLLDNDEIDGTISVIPKEDISQDNQQKNADHISTADDYWLNIRGPGINFSIEIKDHDDLEIVQIMLRKIDKALKQHEL